MRGTIVALRKNFLFVADPEAPRGAHNHIFVHAGACQFDLNTVRMYDEVEVGRIESTPRGLVGHDVAFVSRPATTPFVGKITSFGDRGFVFARSPDDPFAAPLYLHRHDFLDSRVFDELQLGDWISADAIETLRGRRGVRVARTRPECIPAGARS